MTDILALDAITGALADLAIAATELSRKATDAIAALDTLYYVVESSPAANSALPAEPMDFFLTEQNQAETAFVAEVERVQAAQLKEREYILVALGVKHTNLTTNYGPEPPPAVVAAAGAVQEIRVWLATRWDLGHMVVNGT